MKENEKIFTKKEILTPIISIVAFLIMVIGASYAYYSVTTGSAATLNANANVNLETVGCGMTTTNCAIWVNQTAAGMAPGAAGTNVSSNCTMKIQLTGLSSCSCTYTVLVKTNTNADWASSRYVTNSISYSISTDRGRSVAETKIAENGITTAGTQVLTSYTINGTNATTNHENITFNVRAYNLNANQDVMASKQYFLYLQATPTCSLA